MANPKFIQKVRWIRAFAPLGDDARWDIILALNTLRNKVAHKFDLTKRQEALTKLRAQFSQSTLFVHYEQEWKDYNVIFGACVEALVFLLQVRGKTVVHGRETWRMGASREVLHQRFG